MKKFLLAVGVASTMLASCSKSDFSQSKPSTLMLHDFGGYYTMRATSPASNNDVVNISLHKTTSSSIITLEGYNTTEARQFSLNLSAYGPYWGYGTFVYSSTTGPAAQLSEYFNGERHYTVDSAVIIVNESTDTHIAGTYNMWVHDSKGATQTGGNFDTYNPIIY